MYEKHIKAFEQMSRGSENAEPWKVEAIDAAIRLMRAAGPKDPMAERERCEEEIRHAWPRGSDWEKQCLVARLLDERAAARAEGYVLAKEEFEILDKPSIEKLSRALDENRTELTKLIISEGVLDDFVSTADAKLSLAAEECVVQLHLKMAGLLEAGHTTQRRLAKMLRVSEARVSQMFASEGNLTIKTLARVACALGHKLEVNFAQNDASAKAETSEAHARATPRAEGYAEAQGEMSKAFENSSAYQAQEQEHFDLETELAEARAALRIMSENEGRLQARIAELEIIAREDGATVMNLHEDVQALETKLTAANARIAELETATQNQSEAAYNLQQTRHALETKLAAANAQIAELAEGLAAQRDMTEGYGEAAARLETKLSNLRAAAKRALDAVCGNRPQSIAMQAFARAIEASK